MIKTFAAVAAAVAVLACAGGAFAQAAPAAPQAPAAARPTIASPIKALLANPQTKPVLEKHLPGISAHPALPQFQDLTLAQVAPMSEGEVTDEIIARIDADLQAIPAA